MMERGTGIIAIVYEVEVAELWGRNHVLLD